ncbi:poly-gamma-glutamate synthesis protein (capsule biosynthesis protein) [Raineyella antarctica]|uniref:Poly-gamma-glutamate synthesis protein (Capsule biosynthesis protein) n=1 Tax=Raineyella antarctica TaxID=1577474 RepID=A0A1G6GFG1_9ACTN|nr:poly-gamma-glutamate synthesis protein (capsule biosynthesis protein) [Raineyella antarctica]
MAVALTVAAASITALPNAAPVAAAQPRGGSTSGCPASSPVAATKASCHPTTAAEVQYTWHQGCPVGISKLTTIDMNYLDFAGTVTRGQIVVATQRVADVLVAFDAAYSSGYQIAQMTNPNAYQGDDVAMMEADNTSGFNCRLVTGGTSTSWSAHSYGTAVDINPVENPYHSSSGAWYPSSDSPYILGDVLDRDPASDPLLAHPAAVLRPSSAFNQAFASRGWTWGGGWLNRDYQHFQR